jgi:serine O-acetyltransferase
MEQNTNDILLKNVALLSKLTEQEVKMMPATEAPLPSVEKVVRIVTLVKNIIFPDYMGKRQADETKRSYHIGECMLELHRLLVKQIAHGLQFCEDCEEISTKEKAYE